MLDVAEQLKLCSIQLQDCFKNKKLPLCLVVFIFTGMLVLWIYICQAIMLFFTRLLQIPAEGLDYFIKNKDNHFIVRTAMLLVAYPVALVGYVCVPFFYIVVWLLQFSFNCSAFITSLGKAKWENLMFG